MKVSMIYCDGESMKLPTEEKILKDYYSDYKDENEARMHYSCDLCGPYLDVIRWHPFPEEKPSEEEKEYIVTVESETIGLFTICSEWQGENGGWAGVFDHMVKAWAEMPRPYEEVDG